MVSIVPILTIQFIGYYMNSKSLKHKIDTLMVDNLTQLSERVDLTMDIYANLVYQIYVDDKVIENVNVLMKGDGNGREVAFHTIYNRLQQAEKSVKGVRSISVICANGQSVTYDAVTGSSIENLWDDYADLREIIPCQAVMVSRVCWLRPQPDMPVRTEILTTSISQSVCLIIIIWIKGLSQRLS